MSKANTRAQDKLAALAKLLDEEEREVRTRADEVLKRASSKELEAGGALLRKGRIVEVTPLLFGRTRVVVGEDAARPGHVRRFDVRPGAVVWLMERDEQGAMSPVADGVVAKRTATSVEVVFDAAEQVGDIDEAVDLLVGFDEVTLRRLRAGLDAARSVEGRRARLVEMLLGTAPIRATRLTAQFAAPATMNADQAQALRHALHADDVALVHGPPGTGKTHVLVEVVRQLVGRGERVLALAASNAAVDHLALSILDADPDVPLARLGQPARVSPALEQHTLVALTDAHEHRQMAKDLVEQAFQLLRQARRRSDRGHAAYQREREVRAEAGRLFADARRLERQAAASVLSSTKVLCATLTGLRDDVLGDLAGGDDDKLFDTVVIDEASQALTPAVLLGALRGRRVVLAGDHKQLPPTVLSVDAARRGLADTVFRALCDVDTTASYSHMLTVQHRMHEAIMAFPSTTFYGGQLTAHPSVAQHSLAGAVEDAEGVALPQRIVDVIDTAGTGHEERSGEGDSKDNPGEAGVVIRVVRALVRGGLAPADIGLITPYAAQVALLSTELADLIERGLEIDSVDGFQGREKEAIVMSAVRSNADGAVGFLADERRTNVAITRARKKLVVVGDSATLSSDPVWRALFDHAIETGGYRSAFELPEPV